MLIDVQFRGIAIDSISRTVAELYIATYMQLHSSQLYRFEHMRFAPLHNYAKDEATLQFKTKFINMVINLTVILAFSFACDRIYIYIYIFFLHQRFENARVGLQRRVTTLILFRAVVVNALSKFLPIN